MHYRTPKADTHINLVQKQKERALNASITIGEKLNFGDHDHTLIKSKYLIIFMMTLKKTDNNDRNFKY